jgi:hypothetical protein
MDCSRTLRYMLTARQEFGRKQSIEDPSVAHSQWQLQHNLKYHQQQLNSFKTRPLYKINIGDDLKNFDIIDRFISVRKSRFTAERKTGSC